jgi:conjugative transfer signal peptidase TraF
MIAPPEKARPLPMTDWIEQARLYEERDRKRRRRIACGAVCMMLLLATLIVPPPPLLVWNASPSAPMGLYRLSPYARIKVGDIAVTWVPPVARQMAARRHYLPSNIPLVKRVAGIAGDRICAIGPDIFINGKWTVARWKQDGKGQQMPWWHGCVRLRSGELFVIATAQPQAFDGRYFGPTRAKFVVGRAVLLWAR